MQDLIGRTLGHYRIVEKIGEGGMGVVYRAHDERLDRDVAVKVLPEAVAEDVQRLARFEREAKLLASLNHSNVATLHGLEEHQGQRYLVMELVEGESLAGVLARGAIPVDDALPIALQITEGLEAAHENGIIHRDLKPANVMVSPEGKVKVLDFGLAKAWEGDPVTGSSSGLSQSPTLAHSGTQAGVILGTAAYMSPEQARGKPVDKRADIWAFGVVLFEMLTGQRLFSGDEVSDTLASILKDEPDWTLLPAATPRRLSDLLRRCLRKSARSRLHDIADARIELEETPTEPADASESVPATPQYRERLAWLGVAAFALSTLVLALALVLETPQESQPIRFAVPPPADVARFSHVQFAVSPDGRSLAFVGITADRRRLLGVRPLDSNEVRLLPGTDDAVFPFWSPDSQFIGYFAGDKLKRVRAYGGPTETLSEAPELYSGGSWNVEDVIVVGSHEGIQRVDARGGSLSAVTALDEGRGEWAHAHPQFLPGGDHFLFLARSSEEEKEGVYVGSLDSSETRRLLSSNLRAHYLRSGHLLSVNRGELWVSRFDADTLEVSDRAFPLAEQVRFNAGAGAPAFSVSENGVVAYRTGMRLSSEGLLTWRSRDGREPALISDEPIQNPRNLRLSPDGRRLALTRGGSGEGDLWVYPLDGRPPVPLTRQGGYSEPVWSPDGTRVVFRSNQERQLFWMPADGSALEPKPMSSHLTGMQPGSWPPNGNELVAGERGRGIFAVPFDGEQEPRFVAEAEDLVGPPRLSPDGRWLAYSSTVTGQREIWVRPYPGPGPPARVTSDGGADPVWSRDGRELFYLEGPLGTRNVRLMGVKREGTSESRFGAPQVVVDGDFMSSSKYDVAPDGRFVMIQPTAAQETEEEPLDDHIVVVINWFEELKRLVPTE